MKTLKGYRRLISFSIGVGATILLTKMAAPAAAFTTLGLLALYYFSVDGVKKFKEKLPKD